MQSPAYILILHFISKSFIYQIIIVNYIKLGQFHLVFIPFQGLSCFLLTCFCCILDQPGDESQSSDSEASNQDDLKEQIPDELKTEEVSIYQIYAISDQKLRLNFVDCFNSLLF